MAIGVTGASGNLGRLAIEALLERGVAPGGIVAIVRTPAKVADLAARGVVVRTGDYDDVASLRAAFAGIERLLFVSGSDVGARIAQHTNVIDAAQDAGVGFIAYTSIPNATESPLALATEHKLTEELLDKSGIPHALLRNGWYWENYTNGLADTVERGVLIGAAGDGVVTAAARKDYAEAAAAVLTTDGHDGRAYELGGDERLTYAQLAEQLSAVAGTPVRYENLDPETYTAALVEHGVPAGFAEILADSDQGIEAGVLDIDTGDLQRLIGRPSTPVAEVLRAALV